MEIKVVKALGSPSRTTTTLDLVSELAVSSKTKKQIEQNVGEYLVEAVLSKVGKAQSPVAGESWEPLSKGYKKKKIEDGLPGKANMEFEGDMLDSLDFKSGKEGLEIGFFNKEAWKADGHLKFSGEKNNTPQRRFLPGEEQEFTSEIKKNVEKIIAETIAEESDFAPSDFKSVSNKSDLYAALSEKFEGLTRAEIKRAVLTTPSLVGILDDLDLLELL